MPWGAHVHFDEQVSRVSDAIEAYLLGHPHAKDTSVGIRDWWLPGEYRSVPDAVLAEALTRLVGTGRVSMTGREPAPLYSATDSGDSPANPQEKPRGGRHG